MVRRDSHTAILYRTKMTNDDNDWGFDDVGWNFGVPDPGVGPRKYNQDLRREQGLEEDECPYYGTLVQTREIYRRGQVMVAFYYSTGWVESWYWKHCPPYRYTEGYIVEGEWYPPDWDRSLGNDIWWELQERGEIKWEEV